MCKESVNVEELRKEVMADGVVTKEEVEMLWEKKDSQEGNTSSEFDAFFAEAVMAWLLADGKIDEEEAQFLVDKSTRMRTSTTLNLNCWNLSTSGVQKKDTRFRVSLWMLSPTTSKTKTKTLLTGGHNCPPFNN